MNECMEFARDTNNSHALTSVTDPIPTQARHTETVEQPEQADVIKSCLVDASSQTDFVVVDVDLAELKQRMASGTSTNVKETLTASSIKAAAQSVLNKSGWVYDQRTRTYFDYSTNLYYYPETRLFYNYKNGCYYRYNQGTQRYEFQYQLESFKDHPQIPGQPSQCARPSRKRIEVKQHELPNLKKVKLELSLSKPVDDNALVDDTKPLGITDGCPPPNKIRKLAASIDSDETFLPQRSSFKGYYSDSETKRSRKKYKYYFCNVCHHVILPTCCRQNKPIKERVVGKDYRKARASDTEIVRMKCLSTKYTKCLDCYGLSSSNCCVQAYLWCDPVHARPKRRSRTGKRQKKKRPKRIRCSSSSGSMTETEIVQKSIETSSIKPTKEAIKVDYAFNAHAEFQPVSAADTSVIPCIRAMVTSSQSIDVGTLFIVTCDGTMIGSDDSCDIRIQEDHVAERHALIVYDQQQRNYFITDLGSSTGTVLNSTTVNNPGTKTVLPVPVTHKSILLIGSCIFVLHLHPGYDTCNDCEPGQVKAMLESEQPLNTGQASNQNLEALRRSELKNLKKKYHLHRTANSVPLHSKYTDRAEQRRHVVGSDNPYEKDEMPTSLDTEIADHNKGHQMLKKMGWNKGSSLGKSKTGITEPIAPKGSAKGKHGLGFDASKIT